VSYAISLSGTTVSIASPGPRGVGVPTGGTTGQVLKKSSNTDYDFTWGAETAGLSNIVEDTTPQLGGNLDVNGQSIVSASNGDIAITPNGTGSIILDGLTWPSADGTANQVLKTAGDGTLSFGDASTVAALNDLTDVSVGSEAPSDVLVYRSGSGWINDPLDYTEITSNVGSGSADHSGGTVAAGSITDVIALTNTQYTNLTSGADPNTLYVITDGTTSIGDSDDVTITGTPSDHSFLVYDSATSDWINRTAAQAQADLGISAFGTTLIDDADAATARATLGANDASNLTTGTLSAARLPAITDSYVGHIETIADGTYYIDVRVPAGRTLTSFYIAADSGASATVDLQEGGVTMLSATASLTGGTPLEILTTATTPTISDTALAADAVLTIVLSGSSSGDNFRFAVEYTQ
jgi:hypothetical protein